MATNTKAMKRKSEFGSKGPTPKKTKKGVNTDLQKPVKKVKTTKGPVVEKQNDNKKDSSDAEPNDKKHKDQVVKPKFAKTSKKGPPVTLKQAKAKKLLPKGKIHKTDKIDDWNEFKKQKKELKLKRKQSKGGFDVIVRAKQIGEELRRRVLKGGEEKRVQLINELHSMLKGKGHYAKFVVAHDTARIVQWLLKYASNIVIQQISKELIPETVNMLQSKYGVFCVKRLLKYGTSEVRSQTIDAMLGNVVKLTSHAVSAPVVEYAFSTWATPTQKQYLVQEFYGDLYKKSKDSSVKHLHDVYKTNESLKAATLGAVKTNLMKILNKSLLDSGIVQAVLSQYLTECSEDDRKELISQLAPHIVVISNSREGAKAAMQCIWHGSNKDRKVIMKTMKEHIIDLSKHEHGHATVISLLDSIDDTVLLHKIILSELLKSVKDLAVSEWGRKILLWLVAPADTTYFHPTFVKELTEGREASSCKKSAEIRRKEILQYSLSTLLNMISEDAEFWLSNASLAIEMNAVIKAGSGEELQESYKSLVNVIIKPEWKIKESDNKEVLGVEHAGLHMILKKITQHDKANSTSYESTFGYILSERLNSEILSNWLNSNRGCFLIVAVFENGTEETQKQLRSKLKKHIKVLKTLETPGAEVLLKILGCT